MGEGVRLLAGDCLDLMPTLAGGSVDAIVTDPPYGLSFLGKAWDHGVPGVPFWVEALRVAKPGAHLVAFGGTRTSHRLVSAIEDAGWEIRDSLVWLYGQGMPKGQDIGKAFDKAAGAEREDIGPRVYGGGRAADSTRPGVQTKHEGWRRPWMDDAESLMRNTHATAPATDLAKQWDGWGTGLKPAHEPICLARKPPVGPVARNVAEHGTGGLNIDGCRIGTGDDREPGGATGKRTSSDEGYGGYWSEAEDGRPRPTGGRWPANVILDAAAAAELDAMAGERTSGKYPKGTFYDTTGYRGGWSGIESDKASIYGDTGGASRFFFCPKSSPSERGGVGHPTVKPLALMRWLVRLVTPPGGLVLDMFCGSGSTGLACIDEGTRFVGMDLSAEYIEMARARISDYYARTPLFAEVPA